MNEISIEKNHRLGTILAGMERAIVAFSGGVDSTLLLHRAKEELGDQVVAVVVSSELFRKEEFEGAVRLAEEMGVRVLQIEMKELENSEIVANNPESWYHSKKMLYSRLQELAEEMDFPYVLDGMIMDDLDDFRPGMKARKEFGVRSPLQEAGLYKDEVRELSKQLGVKVWDKPASCSLASRIPYGTKLDKRKIEQVDQAEKFLTKLGFELVRVRHHGDVARIEVTAEETSELLKNQEQIQSKFISLGFAYVALDLNGYRTGSMNEVLTEETMKSEVV